MTDGLVRELRGTHPNFDEKPMCEAAADRIEELQDIIARIQYTNLRRDMNLKNRTIEIDRLCGGKQG